MQKHKNSNKTLEFLHDRGDVIRTRDLYVPNVALYQAEPRPECPKEGPDCEAIGKIPYDTASPLSPPGDLNGRASYSTCQYNFENKTPIPHIRKTEALVRDQGLEPWTP